MSLEVSIKGQDRRHVLDIILREIEQRVSLYSEHGRYYGEERQRPLNEDKLPKKTQAALAALRMLDEEDRKLHDKLEKASRRVEDLVGRTGELTTVSNRTTGWKRYVVVETSAALRERMDGNVEARREKTSKLRDLKERILIAAATDESLEPFIKEMRTISGGRFVG